MCGGSEWLLPGACPSVLRAQPGQNLLGPAEPRHLGVVLLQRRSEVVDVLDPRVGTAISYSLTSSAIGVTWSSLTLLSPMAPSAPVTLATSLGPTIPSSADCIARIVESQPPPESAGAMIFSCLPPSCPSPRPTPRHGWPSPRPARRP